MSPQQHRFTPNNSIMSRRTSPEPSIIPPPPPVLDSNGLLTGQHDVDNNSQVPILSYRSRPPGEPVKPGIELRILPVGDSITVGFSGRLTFEYSITENIGPTLAQRPNIIILLHAGTNDMNSNSSISTEGNDPADAAARLGSLIDKMVAACPDAVILVALIIGTCDVNHDPNLLSELNDFIPYEANSRWQAGRKVLVADFYNMFPDDKLGADCVHPTDEGYALMGDYWYDFVSQIPTPWIESPVGDDPVRSV
ncbi:SGNH hydrolase-type esterase domain-containing protein [Apodospora peruviana]|uniref:SGNH hydrolase-type esterase domain-containing protein n=1 Tax=Apodospora peruviana TaxID=516989 RepID=A0AAE0HSS4_9PEZI|nr:SGNH hydrolase-type esterase domain-containing protein [Apodospora peruviana]